MPYMYSEMQNKLSKTRESPLESMGQIISSRCPGASMDRKNESLYAASGLHDQNGRHAHIRPYLVW